MAQHIISYPIKGKGKEIRERINEFMNSSKKGPFTTLNDNIMGLNKDQVILWCIQTANTYEKNLEEYKKIDLRSKDLEMISIWEQISGIKGIETIYQR